MAVNCGVSWGICAARVTLLDADGNVADVDDNVYVSDNVTSIAMSSNIEEGTSFSRRNGCGCSIARFKSRDIFNWYEFAFEDGALEPAMQALMLDETPILDGVDVVGVAFGGTDIDCSAGDIGVGLEFWSQHILGGGRDGIHPYVHWAFPMSIWTRGDNTAEEDFMANALTGFSRSNEQWGQGPHGDGPPDGGAIPNGAYWKTADVPPTADCGLSTVEPGS